MSGRRRVVAVHHRLSAFVGHRFQEVAGIRDEAPRRGLKPVLVISSWASPAVRAALPTALPLLEDPVFGPERFDERTHTFVEMLRTHVEPLVRRDDIVMMTVATQCEVRAFATWLRGLPEDRRPYVVFLFHSDRWNRSDGARAVQMQEMRVVAGELASLDPTLARRLVFGATTAGLARELSTLLGVRVTEAPLTQTYAAVPRPGDAPNDPPVVGFISGARLERGVALVPDLLDACRRRGLGRFVVHLVDEGVGDAWPRLVAAADAPDVDTVTGELDPAAYGALLGRCDVIVIPYDRRPYRQRQSAVLADAVVAGKAVVVPSGTWLGEQVMAGRASGAVYVGSDAESIADATADCVRRIGALHARARMLSPAWAARQSLGAFFDWMLARVPAALLVVAFLCGGAALAFELPGELSTTLTFATDYDYRGQSLTDRLPAGQASVDWAMSPGPFLGVWTSNVDFGGDDGASIELDYYGGLAATLADVDLSGTLLYYTYPVLADVESYPEMYLQAEREFAPFELEAFVAYSWEDNGVDSQGVYPRFTAKLPLPHGFRLASHVGYTWTTNPAAVGMPKYVDWSVGIRYQVWGIDLTLAYVDTTLSRAECGNTSNCEARPVFSASRTFSTGGRTEERRDDVGRGY